MRERSPQLFVQVSSPAGGIKQKRPNLVAQVGAKTKTDAGLPTRRIVTLKKSNVNPCPHTAYHEHTIRTSDGRTAILCGVCMDVLENRLADPLLIRGMLKSVMTLGEVSRMRREQAEEYARSEVGGAHA